MSVGCRSSPRHPPTFVDFHRLGPGWFEDEKKLDAMLAVFEAATFLPRDIEVIRAKGNARELVGAALQAKVGDQSIPLLIHEALLRGSNDPVVWAAIARTLVREAANQANGATRVPDLGQALAALDRLEPENGLPLCLRAYVELQQGETNAAGLSVKAALQKPGLKLHKTELGRCVMQAALTVKYPRYTAGMMAIGTPGLGMEMLIVGKQLLIDPQLDRAIAEACLELGRRQEAEATLFIDQLFAFRVQTLALEFLKPPGFEAELQRMADAKDKIKKATTFLDSEEAHAASESQSIAYFDTLFEKSEMEAVNELAAKLNYKLWP